MEPHEGRDVRGGPLNSGHGAPFLVSCSWCEKLHRVVHPDNFNPVCSTCVARSSSMRSLEMDGSYPLSDEVIDDVLTRKSPGNYALGYMDGTTFIVFYVGRSDSDVRRRLHDWVGSPSRYDRYGSASKAAWTTRGGGPMPLGRPTLGRVGAHVDSSYTHFAYSYAASSEAAFEAECRNYDDFGGSGELDNEDRPARALGAPGSA